MRLLRAELTRLFARRFTKIMMLALVVALAVVGAVVASQTHIPAEAELQRARSEAAAARADCERHQEGVQPGDDFDCGEITAAYYLPYVLEFRDQMPALLLVFAGLLALFGYLVGASFVGAEWSSGGMTNLLLWRSQRLRVLFGKLTALTVGLLFTGLVLGTAWVATIWAIARFRGVFGDLTPGFWTSLGLDGARGMGLALLTALAGAAIASLGRRTAAALGALIGYLVVWEIGGRIVMEVLGIRPDLYMLSTYVAAFMTKEYQYWPENCFADSACEPRVIGWYWGLAAVGGLAVLATGLAAASFRRRDAA